MTKGCIVNEKQQMINYITRAFLTLLETNCPCSKPIGAISKLVKQKASLKPIVTRM